MEHGDYITFKVNWESNEMQVCELGPVLRQFCTPGDKKTCEITPIVRAMECLTKLCPDAGPPFHFLFDVQYDRKNIVVNVHCTHDYGTVVNVPPERVEAVLQGVLTPREAQIAALMFEGCTIRCIAGGLHIAEGTVKRTVYNIHQKLGVGGQVDMVREIYARLAQASASPETQEQCSFCGK